MNTNTLFQNERFESILSELEKQKHLTVKSLSETLGVSEVTIRKDLSTLEKSGYLLRTHGGATKKSHYTFEKNVSQKESINSTEKIAIAQKAVTYIDNNDAIMLASGTTIHYLAKALKNFDNLTVLTASLQAAIELCSSSTIQVIQMGGEVRKSSSSVMGTFTEISLAQFTCNKLFLGIDGISSTFGISTSNLAEASLNQKMIEYAEKIFVLGDSSKIEKQGFGKICGLDKIDYFITDHNITEQQISELEDAGISVIIS